VGKRKKIRYIGNQTANLDDTTPEGAGRVDDDKACLSEERAQPPPTRKEGQSDRASALIEQWATVDAKAADKRIVGLRSPERSLGTYW